MTFYEILIFNHGNGRSKVITEKKRERAILRARHHRARTRKASVRLTRVTTKEISF